MEIVNEDGEVISPETVEYSYTREGRKEIGKEYPNPIPVEAPIPQQPYEPVWETIKRLVVDHMHRAKVQEEQEEFDSEEEADDFDVGDDYDPSSPFEESHEPTDPWPMSTAARQMEQSINELRNRKRIDVLKEELEALQQGKEWPPAPAATPPAADTKNEP